MSLGDDGAYTIRFAMSRHCDKWNYIDGEWCIVEREAATDYNFAWTLDSCAAPYENAKMGRDDFSYRFLEYGQTGEARR